MKIAVVLPSRGNPQRLVAVLTALEHLTSGKHEVRFHVFVDDDDSATIEKVRELDASWTDDSIKLEIGSNTVSHFNRINDAQGRLGADVLTWFTDDVFPLALRWDDFIAIAVQQGLVAFAWTEVKDPDNVTYPIVTRRWLDALGYLFPPYFPFWFVDIWIMEVFELAFGQPFPIVSNLPVGGRRGRTGHMHELPFWFDFFQATRCERVRDAERVAQKFSTQVTPDKILATRARHHQRVLNQIARLPHFEKRFSADSLQQSERYQRLKSEAETWLEQHEDQIFADP